MYFILCICFKRGKEGTIQETQQSLRLHASTKEDLEEISAMVRQIWLISCCFEITFFFHETLISCIWCFCVWDKKVSRNNTVWGNYTEGSTKYMYIGKGVVFLEACFLIFINNKCEVQWIFSVEKRYTYLSLMLLYFFRYMKQWPMKGNFFFQGSNNQYGNMLNMYQKSSIFFPSYFKCTG